MTSLSGEFHTDLGIDDAMVACTEAIDGLGWRIDTVEGERVVAHTDSHPEHPPQIEVTLSEAGEGTDFRIIGSDSEQNELGQKDLVAELDKARDAINSSMEGAEGSAASRTEEQPSADAAAAESDASAGDGEGDPQAAAGWYADVHDESRERYWDGKEWTEKFRPVGGESKPDSKLDAKPAPAAKPEKRDRKEARAEKRQQSRERAEQRRREREEQRTASKPEPTTSSAEGEKAPEAAAASTSATPARFRSLDLIATLYGVLGWIALIGGSIAVIAVAASAGGGSALVTIIGGLIGVAFYALLVFGIAAAIRLALAVEENTRNTVELLRRNIDDA